MRVADAGDVFARRAEFHRNHAFGDELGDHRADDHKAPLVDEGAGRIDRRLHRAAGKALTGASRKVTFPLAEYFDAAKLTLRVGDLRRKR